MPVPAPFHRVPVGADLASEWHFWESARSSLTSHLGHRCGPTTVSSDGGRVHCEPGAGISVGPNLYTYVRQNPWTYFDPHGLSAKLIKMLRSIGRFRGKGGAIVPGAGRHGRATVGGTEVYLPPNARPNTVYSHKGTTTGKTYDVPIDRDGFVNFNNHAATLPNGKKGIVDIDMRGNHRLTGTGDFAQANAKAGIDGKYLSDNSLTWHHHENGTSMVLVAKELNRMRHTGGVAVVKSARNVAKNMGDAFRSFFAPSTAAAYGNNFDGTTHDMIRGPIVDADPSGTLGAFWPTSSEMARQERFRQNHNDYLESVNEDPSWEPAYNTKPIDQFTDDDWEAGLGGSYE